MLVLKSFWLNLKSLTEDLMSDDLLSHNFETWRKCSVVDQFKETEMDKSVTKTVFGELMQETFEQTFENEQQENESTNESTNDQHEKSQADKEAEVRANVKPINDHFYSKKPGKPLKMN
ncbi:unnamed protein product [Diamesa serratosioi]